MLPPMSAEPIRLQKFLAEAGICSRRAAEAAIVAGEVWVNSQPATLGQKITPAVDKITFGGKPVRTAAQPLLTLIVHKPRGLVCSNDDPHNPDTIFDLLPREYARRRDQFAEHRSARTRGEEVRAGGVADAGLLAAVVAHGRIVQRQLHETVEWHRAMGVSVGAEDGEKGSGRFFGHRRATGGRSLPR